MRRGVHAGSRELMRPRLGARAQVPFPMPRLASP